MQSGIKLRWCFLQLHCILVGSLVDSSSLSSTAQSHSVSSGVGKQIVLPCSWKERLGEVTLSPGHVLWATQFNTMFELRGDKKWLAEDFEGRVEVPEEKLLAGDCSLIISDVQLRDEGTYDSFMVVEGKRSKNTRVFIQSVKLSVLDYKSRQSRCPGEDLVLDLHTRHSVRVVFHGKTSSQWSDLWMRGDENSQRLEKDPLKEQLTIKNLNSSDEGTYKVLDKYGISLVTVQLSVEEHSKMFKFLQMNGDGIPTGGVARSSFSALLWSVVVMVFHICHLL